MKIIKNSVQCNHCSDILVSEQPDMIVECNCKSVSIYGGTKALQRMFKKDHSDYTDLSEVEFLPPIGQKSE